MTKAVRIAARTLAGLAATGLAGGALLGAQAWRTSRREFLGADTAPNISGQFGRAFAPALRLAVLGDSTAAGVGVRRLDDSVAGRLAQRLAAEGRFVTLDGLGVSGSRTTDLAPQVSRALLHPPDIAVVLIGANDATHATDLDDVADDLRDAVRRLREAGVRVVVGTCPDMGAVTALDRPLRDVVGWLGRRVADAQRGAVLGGGGEPVDLAARTGPSFRSNPDRYLSEDGFHPSADGYALWADALAPQVLAAASGVPSRH